MNNETSPTASQSNDQRVVRYFHAVNSGDLIASMPGMRHRFRKSGRKAVIYQKLNQRGHYMEGSTHPLTDGHGTLVTMNEGMLKLLKPLVESQEYIEALLPFDGQEFDVDLNRIHDGTFVNMPYGPIQMWPWFVFPALRCDLSESWITVSLNDKINVSGTNNKYARKLEDCLILNFTERYRNTTLNYQFLRKFKDRLVFAGTQKEFELFTGAWKLDIPYLQVNDFLELAQAIAGAKGFLGNQSMCWNIAEALKVPRACEYFSRAPNCFPQGEGGALYLYQGDVEDWVFQLMNESRTKLMCPVCETENESTFSKQNTDYYRCKNCQTLYSRYLQQEEKVGGEAFEGRSEQNAGRIERIKKLQVVKVLDYGCGNGELVEDAVNSGLQVLGYDKYNPNYNKLPEGAGTFDCVTMVEVIEHTYAPYSELDEIHGLLRDNGFLYIETSFADFLDMNDHYVDPSKGHCTIWSYKGMDMVMKQKGFALAGVINRNTRVYYKEKTGGTEA